VVGLAGQIDIENAMGHYASPSHACEHFNSAKRFINNDITISLAIAPSFLSKRVFFTVGQSLRRGPQAGLFPGTQHE
jgi:hypothetical protein